ncbi:seven-hairpin glycosidase [Tothia fuscella]|uniref:alpha-1,2-Mannosidase n=1 Tax=Tothia fuscella TaxID=1048955 RepID=A0A9P4NVB3_9PEZI|nr:seven-hairpin glycosidase [Tothia fuscella]
MSASSDADDRDKQDARLVLPSPATSRRSYIHKALFLFILLLLIPVVVVPAVILTRGNEARNHTRSSSTNGASTFAASSQLKSNDQRAGAVRDAFNSAWGAYMQNAFPHDQLSPLNNSWSDPRNGWGATAVDSLSTAIVMGLPGPVASMLKHISTIDYTKSATDVSVFETNIRYLGGMLSAYDLLKGPFASLPHDAGQRENLLAQAKKLADTLSAAFNTPSGIPDNIIRFTGSGRAVLNGSTVANLAEMGSLILEWTRLSALTNDPKYAQLAARAQSYLLKPSPPQSEVFPGLIGSYLNIKDGTSADQTGGWGAGSDSFYEYLIKAFVYDPKAYSTYKDRWVLAADSSMMYLTSHPTTRTDLTFLAGFSGTQGIPQSGHLNCFAGGNFLLGGSVLKQQKYIDFGLELTASCHNTYLSTQTGIGPEFFGWVPQECNSKGRGLITPGKNAAKFFSKEDKSLQARATKNTSAPLPSVIHAQFDCANPALSHQTDTFYKGSGFWITNPTYNLRPEVLESYYYAYRITGNTMYQDWAWDAFQAIVAHAKVNGGGFNELGDVNVMGGMSGVGNGMESYFFAETLMYAYAIFAGDAEWHVNYQGGNKFVFNTEGHPLRVA